MTENSHGWIGTETVATRLGDFEFANSYPVGDVAERLRDALVFNRAVETYLVQMPTGNAQRPEHIVLGRNDLLRPGALGPCGQHDHPLAA
jgi:hypothetical protein